VREPRNRVVQVRRFGGPDGLEVVDAPLPKAGRGEVRVRMRASSLEYTDVVIRRRLYPQTMRRRPPFVLGYDVVGEIDQLGDGVSGFQLGDRVANLTVLGSNAAYCTLRADRLTRVPAGLDAAEAAALILSWTTAYQLLHRAARVQRGQRALVQGAAGAVGQALLVLGRLAVGHRARRARGADPRAWRHADRLPTRRLYACPAGRVRCRLRRHRRERLSPLVRGARAPRPALRLRLHGGRGGAAAPRHHFDVDSACVSMEAVAELVAGRQAPPHLLDKPDAGAASRLVPGGPRAALRPVGNGQHPAARRRADLLR
jgi:alcohol dehydrogenase-like protein